MEKTIKLYVDSPEWQLPISADDFVVAIGKTKSNSVYHVAEVKPVPRPEKRIVRYYINCFKSDLMTCLKRDLNQKLIPITWYKRNKKQQQNG